MNLASPSPVQHDPRDVLLKFMGYFHIPWLVLSSTGSNTTKYTNHHIQREIGGTG